MIDRRGLLLVGLLAAAGTWAAMNLLPEHPEPMARVAMPEPVLAETGIRAGRSVTTSDGAFTIRVERIAGTTVTLTVSTKTGDVYRFDKAVIGRRLVVPMPEAIYDLDLLRVRSNVVYLTMSRRG